MLPESRTSSCNKALQSTTARSCHCRWPTRPSCYHRQVSRSFQEDHTTCKWASPSHELHPTPRILGYVSRRRGRHDWSRKNIVCKACQQESWSQAGSTLRGPCLCNAGYEVAFDASYADGFSVLVRSWHWTTRGEMEAGPHVGGVPDGGRGDEEGELLEQVRAGDDARFVALSGLHLPCSSINTPRSNLDHVYGHKILWRKCCKPIFELIEVCLVRGYSLGFPGC